jgi:carboxypeptidase Taq
LDRRLGVCPASDNDGCLQDGHWALGQFGYFPSYGIGAVVAAQFWESIHEEVQGVEQQMAAGEFSGLLAWLRNNVHALGAKMEVPDLVKHATGKPLSASAYLRYLERKYLSES